MKLSNSATEVSLRHSSQADFMMTVAMTTLVLVLVKGAADAGVTALKPGGVAELGEYCQLETFPAACSDGHVVVMRSAVYGRMRLGRCVKRDYGFIGCSHDVMPQVDRLCSGRQRCEFQVAELHATQPCPGDLTPYLEASYECVPVITAVDQRCTTRRDPIIVPVSTESKRSTAGDVNGYGYLSSAVTVDTGRGGPDCPWRLKASPGQRINITLINFARATLPSAMTSSHGVSASQQSAVNAGLTSPLQVGGIPQSAPGPKVCYQLANIRERQYSRVLTECVGSPRESSAFLSSSDVVEVDIIVAKILKVYFLLHFQVVGCANPSLGTSMYLRRDGNTATVRCNTTGDESNSWQLTCHGTEWQWHGPPRYNCTTNTIQSTAGSDAVVPVRSPSASGTHNDEHSTSWAVGQLFPFDSFPYSILIVVSVGVALGVFVGGVLLVGAARYFKRLNNDQQQIEYVIGTTNSPTEADYFRSLHPGQYSVPLNGAMASTDTSDLLGKTLDTTLYDVTPNMICDVIDNAKQQRPSDHPDSHGQPSRLSCYRCGPFADCEHLSSGIAGGRWATTRVDMNQSREISSAVR